MASKIICTPRADLPPGANGVPGLGAVGGKDQAKLIGMGAAADSKPPSLAGVEKFIRAKVAAEAAKNKQKASAAAAKVPVTKPPAEDDDAPAADEPGENLDLSDGAKDDDEPMD